MSDSIFISLILNIGLLVLIATGLTKVPVVRRMLLYENNTFWSRLSLAVIFGGVSILSTYTGSGVQGAIVNTRVIGVMAAGLLGGPSVGIGAAVIAGAHRFLFDIGGFTAVSCALSTFIEGMLGAVFSKYFLRGRWASFSIFLLTAAAEVCQMLIILLIARPYADALALVKTIASPMIVLNAFGMVVFIWTFNVIFVEEDHEISSKVRLAFQIVDQSLPHLKSGLRSKPDMEAAAQIIFDSIKCSFVAITDNQKVLASCTLPKEAGLFQVPELLRPALQSMEKQQVVSDTWASKEDQIIIAAPLVEMGNSAGCLLMAVKKQWHSPHASTSFLGDLAKLFSTQLELSDLDYQKRLRKKAEFLALQSQVNPHFLYNALNTISSVCRENPSRARELLLVLSTYYRQTLENDRFTISLATELRHVQNYLEIEKARFEDKLQVDIQVPDNLHCMVPAFILQPLVENSIRHGGDKYGNRYIKILVQKEIQGVRIHVIDQGTGVDQEVIRRLYSGADSETGFGLGSVYKRLLSIYGEAGALQIHTSSQGSDISFLIMNTSKEEEIHAHSSCG